MDLKLGGCRGGSSDGGRWGVVASFRRWIRRGSIVAIVLSWQQCDPVRAAGNPGAHSPKGPGRERAESWGGRSLGGNMRRMPGGNMNITADQKKVARKESDRASEVEMEMRRREARETLMG